MRPRVGPALGVVPDAPRFSQLVVASVPENEPPYSVFKTSSSPFLSTRIFELPITEDLILIGLKDQKQPLIY